MRRLLALYRSPLTIRELNRERSKLCALKAGGAARLSSRVRARVAGTGCSFFRMSRLSESKSSEAVLFWDFLIGFLRIIGVRSRAAAPMLAGGKNFDLQALPLGDEKKWSSESWMKKFARRFGRQDGVLIFRGGEPQVGLPARRAVAAEDKCQIAARLALNFWDEIREGRVEIFCALVGRIATETRARRRLHFGEARAQMPPMSPSLQRQLKKAIDRLRHGPLAQANGFLIPARSTGTNLQDLILIRVSKSVAS